MENTFRRGNKKQITHYYVFKNFHENIFKYENVLNLQIIIKILVI